MAVGRAVFQIENADRAIRVLRLAVVIHERRRRAGESTYWQERANQARASASEARDARAVLMLSEIAHLCNRMAKSGRPVLLTPLASRPVLD
jgi:hypothetical protein